MSLRFRKRLLEHLKHDDYTPRSVSQLRDDLGVEEQDHAEFDEAIEALKSEKLLEVAPNGAIGLPSLGTRGGTVLGKFRKAMKGFGFVEPLEAVREGSIFIPPEDIKDALSGDVVRVAVRRDKSRDRFGEGPQFVGEIIEVVERKRSRFTGELVRRGGQWIVFPDGREVTEPIVVRDAAAKNAPEGSKVVIEMVVYPQGQQLGEGVITRVLGDAGRPDVETEAVIAAYDLPGEFPEECNDQARDVTVEYDRRMAEYHKHGAASFDKEGWGGRADLTQDFIITIDPPDAKDYDDAISIEKLPDGGWKLGVHIADVAYFIPPGSDIDEEAKDRCNSVYLPRRVIPMIPELLSNGICSLQEGVHRFCKSAFMTYDKQGVCRSEGVQNTLIKSAKRLTYLEAQALIDGDFSEARRHAKTPPKYTDQLLSTLQEMNACARAIEGRRNRQGMISLELPEVVLIYDDNGHVVDAEREDSAYTHKLIEMFMVEANEVLARLFERMDVPLLRRTHPDPTPGDVDNLRKAAMVAGFRIPKNPTREELQSLLNATRGTPASRAVHMAVLRTMSKAEYSPAMIGHFALASEAYAHFTSPIRRYADLTVHRALAEYLRQTRNATERPKSDGERKALGRKLRDSEMCPDESTLVQIGRHATIREENAESAERSLRQFLVLQLLEKHIGESFRGVITGISPKGVFVQIDKYLAEGFVKKEDLPGDVTRENLVPFWKVDPRTGALVDQRSGRSYNMGDTVSVKVVAVDLPTRRMDLVVDAGDGRAVGKAKLVAPNPNLGGGFAKGKGAGFGDGGFGRTGSQRRSQKSKTRDKGKPNWRRDKGR
ncbi:MAG: VacB/RNase II family 3'-5' exoribonuclease [Phycisphaerales bacterium]|nr:VacB/RNase II family 3'-5' exoribonuclease [Planctomycetota bacterium]